MEKLPASSGFRPTSPTRLPARDRQRSDEIRYEIVSRATRDAIWDWNFDTGEVLWNEAICTEYGYEPNHRKATAGWWMSKIHPDDRFRIIKAIQALIESQDEVWIEEYRYRRADGDYAHVLDRGFVLRSHGKGVRMIGAMQDVTERKRGEERLREALKIAEVSREMLQNVFAHSPALIAMWKGDELVFELANSVYQQTSQKGEAELIGHRMEEVFPEAKASTAKAIHGVFATGLPYVAREMPSAVVRFEDGSPKFFDYTINPVFNDEGVVERAILVGYEVTDRVMDRQKMEKLTTDLQNAIRVRDEFLSIASHELKTPVTSLKLQLQMTRRGIRPELGQGPSPEKLIRVLDISNVQLGRLSILIDDLLDVSRIQSGNLTYRFERTDFSHLVSEVFERFSEQLSAAGIIWSLTTTGSLDIICDKFRIEQVVSNLISNAIKYGAKKPIRALVKRTPAGAELKLTDHGIGVPPEKISLIFERFERAISHTNISGLGLGLFISKEIVQKHGGTIQVESELDKGTTFTVILPDCPPGACA